MIGTQAMPSPPCLSTACSQSPGNPNYILLGCVLFICMPHCAHRSVVNPGSELCIQRQRRRLCTHWPHYITSSGT